MKDIVITPERIGLYLIGGIAVGGAFYLAYNWVKGVQEDAALYQQGGAKPNVASSGMQIMNQPDKIILANANTNNQSTVIIPAVSYNYKGYQPDEFPLRRGQGGQRILMLQKALNKLGYLPANLITGGFFDKTEAAVKIALRGKIAVSEKDFIDLVNQTGVGLQGLPDVQTLDAIL